MFMFLTLIVVSDYKEDETMTKEGWKKSSASCHDKADV